MLTSVSIVLALFLSLSDAPDAPEAPSPAPAPAAMPVPAPAAMPAPVAAAPVPAAPAPARAAHPDRTGLPEQVVAQLECLEENDDKTPAVVARRQAMIPRSYLLRVRALAGGFAGGDSKLATGTTATEAGIDYGYTLAGTASLGLLHPLQLDGGVRYFGGGATTALHVDATAALSFRSYGNRWVDAGYTEGGGIVHSWDSHCQLRRVDNQLFGGAKLIRETLNSPSVAHTIPALQLGYASHHLAGSAVDFSIAGLWSPSKKAYGGQLSFGASRLLIAMHIPVDWIYTNMSVGGLFGETVATWWMTLDLGVALEL